MSVVFRIESPYRSPYELHRLSFGSGSPSVAIVAGLHGNELNAIHAVNMLVSALRDTDKDVRREAAKALGVVGSAPVGGGSP